MTDRKVSFEQAKRDFPDRYTVDNVPQWARKPAPNGRYFAPHYASDREWYESQIFPGEPGLHGNARQCKQVRRETLPMGKWLDAPLKRAYTRQG